MKNYPAHWVEIDKLALLHNLRQFAAYADKKTLICPVLKANAYGHGLIGTAKILKNEPIWGFSVVNLSEALTLRQAGLKNKILVLSYIDDNLGLGIKNKIRFPLYSYQFASALDKEAKSLGQKAFVHLKADVGTNRLGLKAEEIISLAVRIKNLKNIKIEGLFSHLADSENENWAFTEKQLDLFSEVINSLEKKKIKIPLKHLACSAAASQKKCHYNFIRLGLSLYGLWPSMATKKKFAGKINLKPALSWRARIIQVKAVKKGEGIGYGASYKAGRNLKIAVIPVGYYEGYDRKLSNKNFVLVKGKKCRVLGRVCMNMHMIDVSRVNGVKTGDLVTLIGVSGRERITAENLAENLNTINYEITTRINPLIPRIYV